MCGRELRESDQFERVGDGHFRVSSGQPHGGLRNEDRCRTGSHRSDWNTQEVERNQQDLSEGAGAAVPVEGVAEGLPRVPIAQPLTRALLPEYQLFSTDSSASRYSFCRISHVSSHRKYTF